MVAGGMPIPVVHLLSFRRYHEGYDELPVRPPCTVDLTRERDRAHPAVEGSGEVVQVSAVQLGLQRGTFIGGLGSILRGHLSIGRGPNAAAAERARIPSSFSDIETSEAAMELHS